MHKQRGNILVFSLIALVLLFGAGVGAYFMAHHKTTSQNLTIRQPAKPTSVMVSPVTSSTPQASQSGQSNDLHYGTADDLSSLQQSLNAINTNVDGAEGTQVLGIATSINNF